MADAILTQERLKELFNYDYQTGIFTYKVKTAQRVKVGNVAGGINGDGYVHIRVDGTKYKAHRLAWLYVYGEFPKKHLDHINRLRNDNRIVNLRLVNDSENCQNQAVSKSSSTGFIGVSFHKKTGKYQASIKVNRKQIYLGLYESVDCAFNAYVEAKRNIHPFGTI